MSAIVTVRRIGNSLGIILPRHLVEERGLHERDRVSIDPKRIRDIEHLRGILRRAGGPGAYELNRAINEGEEL